MWGAAPGGAGVRLFPHQFHVFVGVVGVNPVCRECHSNIRFYGRRFRCVDCATYESCDCFVVGFQEVVCRVCRYERVDDDRLVG